MGRRSSFSYPALEPLEPRLLMSGDLGSVYYASPAGAGDGSSIDSPFRISDFWGYAQPGDTLCLLDGRYTGAESMITPPPYLAGTPGNPITVRALNDGRVELDGESACRPIYLNYNDYFVIEGVNAHSSSRTVTARHNFHTTMAAVADVIATTTIVSRTPIVHPVPRPASRPTWYTRRHTVYAKTVRPNH